jgi:hypothetical protein
VLLNKIMKSSNGTTSESSVFAALRGASEIPGRIESGMKAHPLKTAAAVAGLSFVGGAVFGSRLARAVFVAAAPTIVKRLLDGPLGDDLTRYLRGAIRGRTPDAQAAS